MAIVVDITEFKRLERNGSVISAVFAADKSSLMSGIMHERQEVELSVEDVLNAINNDTYRGEAGVCVRQAGEAMGLFI